MKTNLLKTLLVGAALMLGLGASAQTERFYVGVTGYNNNHKNAQTVYATMYDNFAFSIKLPEASAKIGATYADVQMRMTGVEGLGLAADETRNYSVSYDTGVTVTEQTLSEWLPNSYALADSKVVSVPVTVVDYIKTNITPTRQTFTYTIAGVEKTQIVGTPSSTEDARKAWAIITNETTATRPESHDSKFILKAGAYFQIGNEKVFCDGKDVDLLVNNGQETVQNTLTSELSYTTVTEDTKKVVLYLPAGSTMKVDNSMAELDNNCTITFDCSNLEEGALDNLITTALNLNGATTEDAMKKISIQNVLKFFDALIGLIDKATVIPCTVQFGEPTNVPFITVYAGKETPEDGLKTIAEFNEIKNTKTHNALGFVDAADAEEYAVELRGVNNIVVKYPAGKAGNYYYESPKLVLTDIMSTPATAPDNITDFYSPVDFIAVTGGYYREFANKTSTCCLPFELTGSDFLNGDGYLMTFAFYEALNDESQSGNVTGESSVDAYAYFNKRATINAGVPCFIYNTTGVMSMDIAFENTKIVGTPDNSANLQGTFISGSCFASTDFWGIDTTGQQLGRYSETTTAYPFRSALTLTHNAPFNNWENHSTSGSVKRLFIGVMDDNGDATSIDGVQIKVAEKAKAIYNINGAKVSNISKPGLYIVNGVKMFAK